MCGRLVRTKVYECELDFVNAELSDSTKYAVLRNPRYARYHTVASPRFVDRSPAEVVATLLGEGQAIPLLGAHDVPNPGPEPTGPRTTKSTHPPAIHLPELVGTGANQTWSWDITRLLGPTRWTYYYLYVLLDIFSRYAVGWMVAERESSTLAGKVIEQNCLVQGIAPQTLTLHSDSGHR